MARRQRPHNYPGMMARGPKACACGCGEMLPEVRGMRRKYLTRYHEERSRLKRVKEALGVSIRRLSRQRFDARLRQNPEKYVCDYCGRNPSQVKFVLIHKCSSCMRTRSKGKRCATCGGPVMLWGCYTCGPKDGYVKVTIKWPGGTRVLYRKPFQNRKHKLKTGEFRSYGPSYVTVLNSRVKIPLNAKSVVISVNSEIKCRR
jgi:hypothetical protein